MSNAGCSTEHPAFPTQLLFSEENFAEENTRKVQHQTTDLMKGLMTLGLILIPPLALATIWFTDQWNPDYPRSLEEVTHAYGSFTNKTGGRKIPTRKLEAMPHLANELKRLGYPHWEDYAKETTMAATNNRRSTAAGDIPAEVRSVACHLFTIRASHQGIGFNQLDECMALIKLESGFNPDTFNPGASDYGMPQAIPERFAEFVKAWKYKKEDAFLAQCDFMIWAYRDICKRRYKMPTTAPDGSKVEEVERLYILYNDGQNTKRENAFKRDAFDIARRINLHGYTRQAKRARWMLGRAPWWKWRFITPDT